MQTIEELYNSHEHLIGITVNRNYSSPAFKRLHCLTNDDLYQFGRIGLFEACKTYDKYKSTSFTTYAINCINWRIKDESKVDSLRNISNWTNQTYDCDSLDTTVRIDMNGEPVNMYEFIGQYEEGYFDVNEEGQLSFLIDKIREQVSSRVADIIELRLQDYNVTEIADILDISHQGVSSVLKRHSNRIKDIIESYKL